MWRGDGGCDSRRTPSHERGCVGVTETQPSSELIQVDERAAQHKQLLLDRHQSIGLIWQGGRRRRRRREEEEGVTHQAQSRHEEGWKTEKAVTHL